MTTPSQLARNHLQGLTRKHAFFDSAKTWLEYVYNTFKVGGAVKLACIHKFIFDTATVFTLVPYGQIITPRIAALAAEMEYDNVVYVCDETVDLESVIDSWDNPKAKLYFCISNDFSNDATANKSTVILNFSTNRTVHSEWSQFESTLGKLLRTCNFDSPHRSTENTLPPNLLNVIRHNNQNCTEAVNFLLAKSQVVYESVQTAETRVSDINQKLGYLNEEIWRQKIADEEGSPWAKSFEFDSLGELVEWVGTKLKVSGLRREIAIKRIIRYCVGGFEGFHKDGTWNEVSNSPETLLIY